MQLIILDRDGVINRESDAFIKSPEEWEAIPGSPEAIGRLCQAGWRVAVATNQSGLARGLFDREALDRIHEKMRGCIARAGGRIDGIFFCPHGPEAACECRKPRPGLFYQIAKQMEVSLTDVPAVGDSLRDLQAAAAAGATPILAATGNGRKTRGLLAAAGLAQVPVYADLAAAADSLLN
ncbi:MAG: D-glycero-beta-D-manno-heptose 1,7-bisphosphate 7-phosphatase [Gammaproteobacteria bacterium]|nr:D-glycero-beta-D-manno-heptose 1,7-bisphosphate 7-phosphatase [Gammaproteobacteria bacterium]